MEDIKSELKIQGKHESESFVFSNHQATGIKFINPIKGDLIHCKISFPGLDSLTYLSETCKIEESQALNVIYATNISPFELSDIIFEIFSSKSTKQRIGYLRVRGEEILNGEIDELVDLFQGDKDLTIVGEMRILIIFGDEEPQSRRGSFEKTRSRSNSLEKRIKGVESEIEVSATPRMSTSEFGPLAKSSPAVGTIIHGLGSPSGSPTLDRSKPSLSYSRSLRNMNKELTVEPEQLLTNVVKTAETNDREVIDVMLDILVKFKSKSTSLIAQDIAVTIVDCFKALLMQDQLQSFFQKHMQEFIDLPENKGKDRRSLCSLFRRQQMSKSNEDSIIQKIVDCAKDSQTEMRKTVQNLATFIMESWSFKEKDARRYAETAFTRRYEDGNLLRSIGLSLIAKKLPIWGKVILATGVTVFCLLKDTYIQYLENFFQENRMFLAKLPNPDYWARLGEAIYQTLASRLKKQPSGDQYLLIRNVINREFLVSGTFITQNDNKLCQLFAQTYKKLENNSNKEKYLSAFNYLTARRQNGRATQGEELMVQTWKSKEENQALLNLGKKKSMTLTNSVSRNRKSTEIKTPDKSLEDSQWAVEEIQLFIVETSTQFCMSLYNNFYQEFNVRVINGSFIELEDEYDCLVLPGNVYGLEELNKVYADIRTFFGEKIITKIRDTIVKRYLGECPLGTCVIIQTEHPKVRFIAYTACYYTSSCFNAYQSMWSTLSAIHKHNVKATKQAVKAAKSSDESVHSLSLIETVITKGFWVPDLGNSESSRQMYLAWKNYSNWVQTKVPIISNWNQAEEREKINKPKIGVEESKESAKQIFDSLLIGGFIEKRGFIDVEGVNSLLDVLLDPKSSEDLQLAAASALATYAFPEEAVPNIRALILERHALELILTLASTGKIKVHFEIDPLEVQLKEHVASGAAGKVYKGIYKGYDVAVKVTGENMLGFDMTEFIRELSIMSILRNPNVLLCFGGCTSDSEKMMIVTEWIGKGTLKQLLEDIATPITWPMRLSIAIQLARGLQFLHTMRLIHCDIKSANIMLTDTHIVKIIDFGTSRIVSDLQSSAALGTPQYLSPEIFNNGFYSPASDVYAYGIVLWELVTRKTPWSEIQNFDIPQHVLAGERPPIPKDCPPKFVALIQNCWIKDPSKRHTIANVIEDLTKQSQDYHLYLF